MGVPRTLLTIRPVAVALHDASEAGGYDLLQTGGAATHTQNFNVITEPGVDAVHCSYRSLWMRGEDAPLAIRVESVYIAWEKLDGTPGKSTQQQFIAANLDKLQMSIGVHGKEPFSVRLDSQGQIG